MEVEDITAADSHKLTNVDTAQRCERKLLKFCTKPALSGTPER
jgi:hypothetical protein